MKHLIIRVLDGVMDGDLDVCVWSAVIQNLLERVDSCSAVERLLECCCMGKITSGLR